MIKPIMTPKGRAFPPLALADKMAGKTGRTQGDKTVANPARMAKSSSNKISPRREKFCYPLDLFRNSKPLI
jgi:hypothetical protein